MTALVVSLIIGGLLLFLLEIFVIPGFGVAGILGLGSLTTGSILAWNEWGALYGMLSIMASFAGTGALLYFFPRKSLTLDTNQAGTQAAPIEWGELVGKTGRSLSPLRPAGSAEFEDDTVDVITDGRYIDTGCKVRVVSVEGSRIVVESLEGDG